MCPGLLLSGLHLPPHRSLNRESKLPLRTAEFSMTAFSPLPHPLFPVEMRSRGVPLLFLAGPPLRLVIGTAGPPFQLSPGPGVAPVFPNSYRKDAPLWDPPAPPVGSFFPPWSLRSKLAITRLPLPFLLRGSTACPQSSQIDKAPPEFFFSPYATVPSCFFFFFFFLTMRFFQLSFRARIDLLPAIPPPPFLSAGSMSGPEVPPYAISRLALHSS